MPPSDPLGTPGRRAFHHQPVLLREVMELLAPASGQLILDGTLGGGGHSEAMLRAGARVVGLDQDEEALAHAMQRLREFGDQFCAMHGNFRDFPRILSESGVGPVDAILLDLGVSSYQLDEPTRGFSFQKDGPLDARMNPRVGVSAADLVNTASAEELERIFREYGEEPRARRYAQAVVKERNQQPIHTTLRLASIIEKCAGHSGGKRHPATRVFQALRMAVNDEMGALADVLRMAPKYLKPGGRLAIITFHSLEDRLVKQTLRHFSQPLLDRPEWPEPRPNPDFQLRLLTRRSIAPSEEEVRHNPRSRSARLRGAERLTSHVPY